MSILKKYMNENKKALIIGGTALAAVAMISVIWLGTRKNAYAVSVEGKVLGIIKTKEEAQSAYDEVVGGIDKAEGIPFIVNETLEVEAIHSSKSELSSYEALTAAIQGAVSYNVEAYEILVDGTSYAVVSTQEEATTAIKDIATKFAPNNGTVTLDVADKKAETPAEVETPVPSEGTNEKVQEDAAKTPGTAENAKTQNTNETQSAAEGTEAGKTPEPSAQTVNENVLVNNDASIDHQEAESKVTISNVEKGEAEEEKAEDAQDIQRTIQSYDFNQEVVIKSCFVEKEDILTLEEAEAALSADRFEKAEYTLIEGDNIWDVAVAFNTTQERILELNPEIQDETKMQIGQTINIEKGVPILSITTIEESTFKELIPGEIQYKPSEHFYEGYTKVIVEGNDGVKELTVEVTKENGEEVSRKTLSEKVLSEAKVTVIAYGVKEKEPENTSSNSNSSSGSSSGSNSSSGSGSSGNSSNSGSSNSGSNSYNGSGTYIHPLKGAGTISSGYGSRWGTFHYGLDFAAPAGTPIYAARAGKVIYSAFNNGGYGKLIIIEHSDGSQTYYAHCSSLYVQVGEQVSQGEKIAGVGTTGDSTGNHLHLEIRINGRPVNPSNYL